jgi:hypothetical protein
MVAAPAKKFGRIYWPFGRRRQVRQTGGRGLRLAGMDQQTSVDGGLELAWRVRATVLDVLARMDHGPRPRLTDRDRAL